MERLIFLVGPTAIGKTGISLELAKIGNGEIISCDSMQVYRGMNIGTSKPAKRLLDTIPHHMVDILDPAEEFSVAQFRKLAVEAIEDILARKKMPLLVGGSGLYVKVLIDGIFEGPPADREFRQRLKEEADGSGIGALYKRLQQVDAKSAEKIHRNDLRRIIRALEVYEKAGTPLSELKSNTVGLAGKYNIRIFGFNMERAVLYRKIDERVDLMFGDGLVEEAGKLLRDKLSMTASQALGYKEVFGCLKGEYSPDEARDLLKRNTRRYAKRQLTWFRANKEIEWVTLDEIFDSGEIARAIWKKLC